MMAAVLCSAALGLASEALGAPPPPPSRRPTAAQSAPVAEKVGVEVMVVHGSDAYERVDPALKSVMQHLRFLNFRGFKLLDRQQKTLGIGDRRAFDITGERTVRVELLARDARQAKLRVQMFNQRGKILDTTVSIHRNKSFMVAGPKHEDGVLVLPLTARY
jgi:hypothetical protein